MRNIQGNILTPKGQLAPRARDLISNRLIDEFDAPNWEQVEGQKAWVQTFQDSNGNVVYAVLELKVTTNNEEMRIVEIEKPEQMQMLQGNPAIPQTGLTSM